MKTTAKSRFSTRMLRMRTRAFRTHGLSRDEFGRITPAELYLLDKDARREREADEKLINHRHASLLSAIYNAPHTQLTKHTKPADFLPSEPISEEQLAAKITNLHAFFGH